MNVTDPIIKESLSTFVGLDLKIETLREKLEELKWLQKSFGRAFLLKEKNRGMQSVPKVQVSLTEYFSVMPNDSISSFSFFIGKGAETPIDPLPLHNGYWNKDVDLIFFLNLKKIDNAKDYYFVEELKEQVKAKLFQCPGVLIREIYSETVAEVYRDFTLQEISRDLLYYPFAAIRFNLTLNFKHCN